MGTYREEMENLAKAWGGFDQALRVGLNDLVKVMPEPVFQVVRFVFIYLVVWVIVDDNKERSLWSSIRFLLQHPIKAIRVVRNVKKLQRIYGNHK